nr:MAG TPA: hypothetical protein [Caudoviricetes sp.]
MFYDIILLLSIRNPATGGGEFIWKSSFLSLSPARQA